MQIDKKLQQWQQAGLINQQTAKNITNFEQAQSESKGIPIALWAAGGLGAFTIVIGIISVIAANWLHTPNIVKLGVDLTLCALLAFAIFKNHFNTKNQQHNQWLREVLIIIYYGFTLASMALIGQVYQLNGSIEQLLLMWTIVTLPLVLLAKGKFIALLWVIATAITYGMNIISLHDFIHYSFGYNTNDLNKIAIAFLCIEPLVFIYLSRIPWLTQYRAVYAEEISRLSWLVIALAGFFCQFIWYVKKPFEHPPISTFIIIALVTAVTLYLIPRLYRTSSANSHLAMRTVLISVFILGFSACWHSPANELIGALTNIIYLTILAWATLKIASVPLFNLLTAIISIRLLVIYFEVFGSMMETGIGLITGGIFTLTLAWLWLKKSTKLAEKLSLSAKTN